jgi:DNA-binding MarR family transcriptional regulator
MKREDTVDYNVKGLWHSISRMYNQYGLDYDITASTGYVLLNIDVEDGTPATKIAPLLGMEPRSLTRMLKSMEERCWIYREKDPYDGRSVRIFLTELGKEKREISRRAVKAFNKKIRSLIPGEELDVFFRVLRQVNEISDDRSLFEDVILKIAEEFSSHTIHNQ